MNKFNGLEQFFTNKEFEIISIVSFWLILANNPNFKIMIFELS